MSAGFTPGLVVSKNVTLRRVRELPVKGEIPVKVGDRVSASTTVGEAFLPGDLQILRIPERMGIEPSEVQKGIKVSRESIVREGEVVCEHRGLFGLFRTTFESPCAGSVEFLSAQTGHVGIRMASKPITISAYIDGEVVGVEPSKSVTIESNAALIQGIFGVGGERRGILTPLSLRGDEIVTTAHIPEDCKEKILFGGMKPELEALTLAAERGAVGLITGSIDDRALHGYLGYDLGIALTGDEDVSMTVIVTEGFGAMTLSTRTLALLNELSGREASINGATQVRAGAERPEIIVSNEGGTDGASKGEFDGTLRVGSKVRIIRVPYFGQSAYITELPSALTKIQTGATARVLRAKLASGEIATVPRANVEILAEG